MGLVTNRKLKRTVTIIVALFVVLLLASRWMPDSIIQFLHGLLENEIGLAINYAVEIALIIEYVNNLIRENNKEDRILALQASIKCEIDIFRVIIEKMLELIEINENTADITSALANKTELSKKISDLLEKINCYNTQLQEIAVESGLSLDKLPEYRLLQLIRKNISTVSMTLNAQEIRFILREVIGNEKEENI